MARMSLPETSSAAHLRPRGQETVHDVNLHNNHVNHWHSFHQRLPLPPAQPPLWSSIHGRITSHHYTMGLHWEAQEDPTPYPPPPPYPTPPTHTHKHTAASPPHHHHQHPPQKPSNTNTTPNLQSEWGCNSCKKIGTGRGAQVAF